MKMEEQFRKKVEQHCKKKEKSKQATKKDMENTIDEAQHTISVLNELALNSEDQRQEAYHAAKTRMDSIVEVKHFGIYIDKKAKDSLHRYLDKHPEKLQALSYSQIKKTAGTSTALSKLVQNLARKEVDHYFWEDDHPYLKNLVEIVFMGVVQHHLATTVPNMREPQTQPPTPETSLHIDPTEQYIPTKQESPLEHFYPSFDAAKNEEAELLENIHWNPDQGGNQQGI